MVLLIRCHTGTSLSLQNLFLAIDEKIVGSAITLHSHMKGKLEHVNVPQLQLPSVAVSHE